MANYARLLIGLLLLAIVLMDLALFEASGNAENITVPLIFSQAGLLALWLIVGKTPLPWRLLAAVAVVGGWGLLIGDPVEVITLTACVMIADALAVWLLSLPQPIVESSDSQASAGLAQARQYSLRFLFACMTATAMGLSMLHYLWTWKESVVYLTRFPVLFVPILCGGQAMLLLAALVAVLSSWPWVIRVVLPLLATWTVCLLYENMPQGGPQFWSWVLESFLLVAMLAVLRLAGYRLVRRFCDASARLPVDLK